jgi:penicillin-binding protein-related factor A (putative recombinase)
MKEADIQVKLRHYVSTLIGTREELIGGFEVKVVRTGNFSLDQLEEQQNTSLKLLSDTALYWKLSDMDIRKKPFDFIILPAGYAYLIIYFFKTKLAYVCLFADILKLKKKIIEEEKIRDISVKIVKL